jgi:hypothetical protein
VVLFILAISCIAFFTMNIPWLCPGYWCKNWGKAVDGLFLRYEVYIRISTTRWLKRLTLFHRYIFRWSLELAKQEREQPWKQGGPETSVGTSPRVVDGTWGGPERCHVKSF